MTTIELAPAILDHLNQEPEERKYWRAGYVLKDLSRSSGRTRVYASETAAWMGREENVRDSDFSRATDAPYQVTRQEVNEFARSINCHTAVVYDEQGQLVEEWSV